MMIRTIRFAAAALALGAAPLAAQPGTIVRLNFGWQPGMRMEVDYEDVRLRNTTGQVDSMRIASTYRMEVSRHAEGFSIAYSDVRWTELPAADPVLGRFYEAVARTTTGGRARTLVSPAGRFLRVEGAQEIVGEVNVKLGPVLEGLDETTLRSLREVASALISPQVVSAVAHDEWNAMVGSWAGGEMRIGMVRTVESSTRNALFPDVNIPVHVRVGIASRVRCTPDESEERCVKVQMMSTPDQEVMTRAMAEFMNRPGAAFDEARAVFAQVNVQSFITVHTEPRTLRPHYLEYRRVVRANQAAGAPSQIDTRIFRFRYLP